MAQRSTGTPTIILIADTRPLVAAGLRVLLAEIPGVEPVAITAGLDHVLDYTPGREIGLILVGEGTDGATPLSVFRRLRESVCAQPMALLVDDASPETIRAGLLAGASGIISTAVEEKEFHVAITRILGGDIYIPDTSSRVEEQPSVTPIRAVASPLEPLLTPRQIEVLSVLAQGNTNRQIAEILAISDSTVSMHLNAAFQALGVRNRTSAALAYRNFENQDLSARAAPVTVAQ